MTVKPFHPVTKKTRSLSASEFNRLRTYVQGLMNSLCQFGLTDSQGVLTRRPPIPATVASTKTQWGKVVRGLQYADPAGSPTAGYAVYKVRLLSNAAEAADWSSGTDYVEGDLAEYASAAEGYDLLYICIVDIPNSQTAPDADTVHWQLSPDMEVRGIALESTSYLSSDLRDTVRWFEAGDFVPLIKRNSNWYFWQTLIPTGDEDNTSIRWNEDQYRAMAVYR